MDKAVNTLDGLLAKGDLEKSDVIEALKSLQVILKEEAKNPKRLTIGDSNVDKLKYRVLHLNKSLQEVDDTKVIYLVVA